MDCDVSLDKCTTDDFQMEIKKACSEDDWIENHAFNVVAELFIIVIIIIIFALFLVNLESYGRNKPFNHLCDAVFVVSDIKQCVVN